jgi:hypothetical protein
MSKMFKIVQYVQNVQKFGLFHGNSTVDQHFYNGKKL